MSDKSDSPTTDAGASHGAPLDLDRCEKIAQTFEDALNRVTIYGPADALRDAGARLLQNHAVLQHRLARLQSTQRSLMRRIDLYDEQVVALQSTVAQREEEAKYPDAASIETITDLLNDKDMLRATLDDLYRQLSAVKAERDELKSTLEQQQEQHSQLVRAVLKFSTKPASEWDQRGICTLAECHAEDSQSMDRLQESDGDRIVALRKAEASLSALQEQIKGLEAKMRRFADMPIGYRVAEGYEDVPETLRQVADTLAALHPKEHA